MTTKTNAKTRTCSAFTCVKITTDMTTYYEAAVDGDVIDLTKIGTTVSYRTTIGAKPYCTCAGYFHRSRCKHVDALTALRAEGKI